MSNPLNRYHRILHAVSGHSLGLSLADLAAATGLPRSTTHRLATSLREIDYLGVDDATGNFVLGDGLVRLMRASLTQDSKLALFNPALNFVVGRLEETAFCARLLNDEVDLVQAVTPTRKDQLYIYPGVGSRPLDKCSSSKAILAYLDPPRIQALLEPLARSTPSLRVADLMDELDQVHRQGFAVCDGAMDEGVRCGASPRHCTGPSAEAVI
ncbi:MAG: helix-turn-helix domain-containing protein, partial [Achromobacter sp.]|uniref:IclR family transcriptional regulator n=1 Tax=Achromobacter sp. TaxID=134375 RepID=UPI00258BC789